MQREGRCARRKNIPGLRHSPPPADQDACVKEVRLNAEKVKKEITIILKKLESL